MIRNRSECHLEMFVVPLSRFGTTQESNDSTASEKQKQTNKRAETCIGKLW